MPIYEYRCQNCGSNFEELIRSSDEQNIIACAICGSKDVQRLISAFGYKSTGFESAYSGSVSNSGCSTCQSRNCSSCH